MTETRVQIEEGTLAVTLAVQNNDAQGTVIKFFKDIYAGYAKVRLFAGGFDLEHRKEIPDHLLWERVDKHPFLQSNPNKKLIITDK